MPFAVILAILVAVVYLDDAPPRADVVFANRGDVFTLDPQRMTYLQDFRVSHAIYEGLARWRNSDFAIIPAVAESWSISDDRLTYTFHLRPDAKWSNGDPVTAHDFHYAWRRALLPDTAANYSSLLYAIDGGRDFFAWRAAQTAAYLADPFRADGDAVAAQTRGMIDRLRALLDADDLPDAIALPTSPTDRDDLRAELDRLAAVLAAHQEGGGSSAQPDALTAAVAEAHDARDTLEVLRSGASRTAETQWMWDRACEQFDNTVGIEIEDARTLHVRVEQPTAYFLDLVCFGTYRPVHRPTVEGWQVDKSVESTMREVGWHAVEPPPFEQCRWSGLDPATGRFDQQHDWAKPVHSPIGLVSNGPYVVTHWRYKREMLLERNPQYHTPELIRSDSVMAVTFDDANTSVLAFESGSVDWLSTVGVDYEADMLAQRRAYDERHADEIAALQEQGMHMDEILASLPAPGPGERRDIHVLNTFGTDFFYFNCRSHLADGRPNPFADAAVRRAFNMAIDKQAIVTQVTRLNEPVATTIVPPNAIPGYNSPEGLPYDVARAREGLEAAGWVRNESGRLVSAATGEPFPVVQLLYSTLGTRYRSTSLVLKAMWEEQLGAQVELDGKDTNFYRQDLRQGNYMVARGGWYGDYGDPTTFLDLCRTGDGNNRAGFSDPYVDELLAEAEVELDPDRRLELLHECERYLVQDALPLLPLCNYVQVYMYDPTRLRGISHHPRLVQYLWQFEIVNE